MFKELNFHFKTPKQNIITLHDNISDCRINAEIMRGRNEYKGIVDQEIVDNAKSLYEELKRLFEKST